MSAINRSPSDFDAAYASTAQHEEPVARTLVLSPSKDDGRFSRLWKVLLFASALLMATTSPDRAGAGEVAPEPEGFRSGEYGGPVPATLKGARVVSTAEAEALWRAATAVFIDVLPRLNKPKKLPTGTVWRDKPRDDIPGSVWLPNTGYGVLPPETEAYFRDGLKTTVGDDASRPVVIYCLAECWMSWNAAKRAIGLGYRNVIWYSDGTDGWAAAGLPLERREPLVLGGD
jgi:PQQ-dependent catabolism-associated CXXCW motif protein